MIIKQKYRTIFFLTLLLFTVITIPLPMYNLNAIAIIGLVISWITYNSFQTKKELLIKNYITFLILSIPFWLTLIGIIYTNNNFDNAFKEVRQMLPFLLFPLILLTVNVNKETVHFLLKQFTIAVSIASLLALLKASYFKFNNLGSYFYYHKFDLLTDKHATYFSLFIVISFLYLIYLFINKNRKTVILLSMFLHLLILYILSVRISIIALVFAATYFLFKKIKPIKMFKFLWLLPIIFGFLFFISNNFINRNKPSVLYKNQQIDDFTFRKLHWQAVLKTIIEKPLFGIGTRGNKESLFLKYKELRLESAFNNQYNTHNQYLEFTLSNGFLGVLLFLFMLLFIYNKLKLTPLALSFFIVFLIYMITESILQRASGITLFSLFCSLLISNIIHEPKQQNY